MTLERLGVSVLTSVGVACKCLCIGDVNYMYPYIKEGQRKHPIIAGSST